MINFYKNAEIISSTRLNSGTLNIYDRYVAYNFNVLHR